MEKESQGNGCRILYTYRKHTGTQTYFKTKSLVFFIILNGKKFPYWNEMFSNFKLSEALDVLKWKTIFNAFTVDFFATQSNKELFKN